MDQKILISARCYREFPSWGLAYLMKQMSETHLKFVTIQRICIGNIGR